MGLMELARRTLGPLPDLQISDIAHGPRNGRTRRGARAGRERLALQLQPVIADHDLGTRRNFRAFDAAAVDPGAVLALKIHDHVASVFEAELGVRARNALLGVRQNDVVVPAAADLQLPLAELDHLFRTVRGCDAQRRHVHFPFNSILAGR